MKRLNFVYYCAMGCVILCGCLSIPNSQTPRFYMLDSINENQVNKKFNIVPDIIIGVGPVGIPEYQDRPQIVTQDKNKMLIFAQFDRWGEPLDLALKRAISEDLNAILPGAIIKIFPWNLDIHIKYQLIIDVIQLESEMDKDLFFVVQWTAIDYETKKVLFIKRSELRQPIIPHNYSGIAKALSAACAELSSEIANTLTASPVNPGK